MIKNMKKTSCTCDGPGYCSRHNVQKTEILFKLCQQRQDYFQAWEEKRGPGQRNLESNVDNNINNNNLKSKLPSDIISKTKRYFTERDKWQKAGKPVRSDKEIFRIFTEICSKCEHFNKKSEKLGSCKVCGCYLKPKGLSFNKIAWATTTCPASQPKWIAEVVLEEEQQNKKKLEQNLWQEQDEKQQNGLKMKEVANSIANNPVPPKKRGGCCGK